MKTTIPLILFAAGSFQNDVQVPELTASVSGGAVSAITITYGGNGGFITSRAGFDNAPQILISSVKTTMFPLRLLPSTQMAKLHLCL